MIVSRRLQQPSGSTTNQQSQVREQTPPCAALKPFRWPTKICLIAWLSWGSGRFFIWGDNNSKIVLRIAGSNCGNRGFGISGIPVVGNTAPRRFCESGAMRRFIVDLAFPGIFQPATAYCQESKRTACLAKHHRPTVFLSLSNLTSCPQPCPSVPGVGWMCITAGLYFLIQSCNSSIDTAGPAGASDRTVGHVDANLDRCVNTNRQ